MKAIPIGVGDRFGRLVAVRCVGMKGGRRTWEFKCDCGRLKQLAPFAIHKGTKSCGCLQREHTGRRVIDLKGFIKGRLKVIGNSGQRKNNHLLWTCLCTCGNIKYLTRSTIVYSSVVSCGCNKSEKAKEHSGSAHWNWQGGRTSIEIKDRNCQSAISWRRDVYERDNYTCVKCGNKGGRLNAHHVNAFNANPGLRHDVNNGKTLCKRCHDSFHRKYGKGNNTPKQFEEFMNETGYVESPR